MNEARTLHLDHFTVPPTKLHLVQKAYISDQCDLWLFLSETLGQPLHPVIRVDAAAEFGAPPLQKCALLAIGTQRVCHVWAGIILHPLRERQEVSVLLKEAEVWCT